MAIECYDDKCPMHEVHYMPKDEAGPFCNEENCIKPVVPDHITRCYSYGKEPHDKKSIPKNQILYVYYGGEDGGNDMSKFPWWLHQQEQKYGKNNFIEINWTQHLLLVKLQQPKE